MVSFLAAMILLVTTGLFVWRLSSLLDVLSRFMQRVEGGGPVRYSDPLAK